MIKSSRSVEQTTTLRREGMLSAGFEPMRGNPNGFQVHRFNLSAKNGAKGTGKKEKEEGKGGKRGEKKRRKKGEF